MSSYISSISTAVPAHQFEQRQILSFMQRHLPLNDRQKRELEVLYRAAGISTRHTVISDYGHLPGDYQYYPSDPQLEPFPTVDTRMEFFQREALKLAQQACTQCLKASDLQPKQITHLITVSCTGIQAPGLDIALIESLGLPTQTQRYGINFMGCYAAFHALKLAKALSADHPAAKVLVVCVELCSLHFQKTTDEDNLLSSTLFGDGAAALLVSREAIGRSLRMDAFYADLSLQAKSEMSWKVGMHGFLMKLSPQVPDTIRKNINTLVNQLKKRLDQEVTISHYAIHPGGKRILEVIEDELGISKTQNLPAHQTLKTYGNMSSPTVLFVLKRMLEDLPASASGQKVLSLAFGPGITLESALLETQLS